MEHRYNLKWLKLFIIFVLVIGIFFRFINLDKKVYWYDEVFTSIRLTGFTEAELVKEILAEEVTTVQDLQKYQHLGLNKTFLDTLHSLATEDPQHPPLYFLLVRFWAQWFGDSVAIIRSLSAIISLLIFPCIYWLCLELFESPLPGWVAIAIVAISPFHVLFAQEARQYSLWSFTILFSSAALLWSMRVKTTVSWSIYAIATSIGFYSFLLSPLVTLTQGIYLILTSSFRLTKAFFAYILAVAVAFFSFLPWLLVVITQLSQIQKTTAAQTSPDLNLFALITKICVNFTRIFADIQLGYGPDLILGRNEPLTYLIPFALILGGYGLYYVYRHATFTSKLFVILLTSVPFLALLLPDLILKGQRAGVSRYVIPFYLGVQISVAYLISKQLERKSFLGKGFLGRLILIGVTLSGILSCALMYPQEIWWNKQSSYYNPRVASVINQSQKPLVISDELTSELISLSYLLNKKTYLKLSTRCHTCNLSETEREIEVSKNFSNFSDVFLFRPSKQLRSKLESQGYTIEYAAKPALRRLKKVEQ